MRLPGFDYAKPFFYMVTLKRLPGLAAFSEISLLDGQCQIVPLVKKARQLGRAACDEPQSHFIVAPLAHGLRNMV